MADIAENLIAVGVPAKQIWVYERFDNQLQSVGYGKYLPEGVNIYAVETSRSSILNYDPKTYVETSFFGEDDTRSNLARLVSETLTKIVNVPNPKEHQASGVTGCLKTSPTAISPMSPVRTMPKRPTPRPSSALSPPSNRCARASY